MERKIVHTSRDINSSEGLLPLDVTLDPKSQLFDHETPRPFSENISSLWSHYNITLNLWLI